MIHLNSSHSEINLFSSPHAAYILVYPLTRMKGSGEVEVAIAFHAKALFDDTKRESRLQLSVGRFIAREIFNFLVELHVYIRPKGAKSKKAPLRDKSSRAQRALSLMQPRVNERAGPRCI
jgi:hypothetical protein